MKTFKNIFLYSILAILMFYVFLVNVNVEGQLAISVFAQERETIFEGFDTQMDSFVDTMTDEKSGAIFVFFGPIYMAIYGHNDFTIWSYGNYINFAPDATHLIRVEGNKPFSLIYRDKLNGLSFANHAEAESVIHALVKGEEINLRYYEDQGNRYNQVDSKLQNIFLGFVYCKAAKLFGWKDFGVSPDLPLVKLNFYAPTKPGIKSYARIDVQGNPDLMLINNKAEASAFNYSIGAWNASLMVGKEQVFGLSSDGEWICRGGSLNLFASILGKEHVILRDSNGIMVLKEELKWTGKWPGGETVAKKAWEVAPLGSIDIEGDDKGKVLLYGFRELWKWGVDNLNFPSLGDDIQTGTETTISTDSSFQATETTKPLQDSLTEMVTWEKTYGGSADDMAFSIIQTTDGGYVVAGSTSSKGAGSEDIWILKLDDQGNLLWNQTYGGIKYDSTYSIIQTTDGGYVVAGSTGSKGAGSADVWIITLDIEGNILWDKTYGGDSDDYAEAIIQTTDGGYAVAVNTEDCYAKGVKGISVSDGYPRLLKLDSQGDLLWFKPYSGWVFSLIQTKDSGYALAGSTSSKGAGRSDLWLLRLDNQGNLLWDSAYGGTDFDGASSLIQTTDGGYAIAGYTASKGAGADDIWIIKVDEQSNQISLIEDSETAVSQASPTIHPLQGSLNCPDKAGYACPSCSIAQDYVNHFKGFNVLTTQQDCYVKLTYNNGDYIGNQKDCEVTIKGEKWLGLEDKSGTVLAEEINRENFEFIPTNEFVERTMNFPQDHYQYEFADEGREFWLYLSRDRVAAFQAVPWQNLSVEIKNKETNKVFTYQFDKGIFPQAYAWSGGVANYGQCVWWAAKRWVEEVDSQNLFPFYPPSPDSVNVKKIESDYQPEKYDILIDYIPGGQPGHYGFVEKVEGYLVYITQFNFIPPGEVYNHVLRPWNGNAKSLYYSNNPNDEYCFKYYYRRMSTVEETGAYALRDIGPAGGYIFYDKGSYSNGWRYLEAAPASTEWTGKEWGSYGTLIGGTGTGIGTGQSNTTTIVTWLNSHSETDRAAQLCDSLVYSGYSDWFLPSKNELNLIYENLKVFDVGGFAGYGYWSSSEDSAYHAWGQGLGSGTQASGNKSANLQIRATRSF